MVTSVYLSNNTVRVLEGTGGRSSLAVGRICELQLPEGCRAWLETTGDLDDFIFYQTEQKISQR